MIYEWIYSFSDSYSYLNVFRYVTFRTFISFLTAFFSSLILGPILIRKLKSLQFKQSIRELGPKSHQKKSGTPTMGGLLILVSLLIPSLLWIQLSNPLVLSLLFVTFSFGLVGFVDDYMKVAFKSSDGLSGKIRLVLEFACAFLAVFFLTQSGYIDTELTVPFLKNTSFDLGLFYTFFGSFVIVGCANAVNFTDGLDGLAIGPVMVAASTFLIFSYISGHVIIAEYLGIPYVKGAAELTPLIAALVASGMGFLWFNSHPAEIFMGDVGSLSLGGTLGMLAVLTNNEILLVLLGGIFVVETLSVIIQVLYFKRTGKRVFRMAPIHHHFELKGMDETKIIVRFWIVSILLAVVCLTTLKLR